jgi:predicted ester cyclase
MAMFTSAFPDARITIDGAVEEGDLVSSRWTITGTHQGPFQGVPATGKRVTIPGVDMSRVVNGQVAEHWAQFDLIGVMVQIGALPPPA